MFAAAIPLPACAASVLPAVSVVIACRNGAATLPETLAGLASQVWDRPWEIVLVDNGSTDGSAAVFAEFAAAHPALACRIVNASDRRGKSYALNVGIAAAEAPAVVFCDADDVPGEGWLAAMGEALATEILVASRVDFSRLNCGWVRESRGEHQARTLEPLPFLPNLVHAGGGTMGFQRRLVEDIGGFDPEFAYSEDTEFSLRAQLAGHRIAFVPEAVMHVRARQDLGPLFRQSFNWACYEMKLVSRFRDRVDFAGGWREYLRSWRRLLRHNLRTGLRPQPETMIKAAWLRSGLGRLAGQFTGMLRYRLPPFRGIGG